MAFPQSALPITVELNINGTWTDISSDVYERDGIRITRGRSEEGSHVDPGTCQMTLDNRSGKYSPRNTASPYYGILGRNTPLRVSVEAGTPSLHVTGSSTGGASTPDAAALDITSDIEVRVEISHDTWVFDDDATLAAKYETTSDQRSWALWIRDDRKLVFSRSSNGTNAAGSLFAYASSVEVPEPHSGRIAFKATFDQNNGAGASVVTFYTADSIDSTSWTQLGATSTNSSVTGIFSSTAPLEVGSSDATSTEFAGEIHALKVYNGIGGTLVADIDFGSQTLGDTSFVDDTGLTWTVNGDAEISNRKMRFSGEVSEWPVRWNTDANDVYVPLTAAGPMRRMNQGASPLQSPLRRAVPDGAGLIAYWPMEDGGKATQFNAVTSGTRPMTFSSFSPASIDTLPGSNPLPTISSSSGTAIRFSAPVQSYTDQSEARVEFVYYTETAPTTLRTYIRVMTTGSVREWQLLMSSTQSRIIGRNHEGTALFTNDLTWGSTTPFGDWWRVVIWMTDGGAGTVDYNVSWYRDGETTLTDSGSVAGSLGRVWSCRSPDSGISTDLDGTGIGHLAVFNSQTVADDFTDVDMGYDGEVAGARMQRLRDEEDLTMLVGGDADVQEALGPQQSETVMSLLQAAADADRGILYESRKTLGLVYRGADTLYSQSVALSLSCSGSDGLVSPLDPVDDDQYVRNDITVSRLDGSSAYAVEASGPMSVLNPPNGVGRYRQQETLNLHTDDQAFNAASWLLHLGTWDETRYPRVSVMLQKSSTAKVAQAAELDIGDRIQLTNPPSWLPPNTIDLLVQGYTEFIHQFRWEFEYMCTPARPWTVAYADDSASRAAATTSDLVTAVNTSATSLTVSSDPRWLTSTDYASEFPFTIEMGGETMSATAITSAQLDAFGRTVASGWGTADIGGAWTATGGSASDYAVGSGRGSHTQTSVNVQRRTTLTAPSANFDIYVDVTTSATATGASLNGGPLARCLDGSNFYTARLEFTTANAVILTLRKRLAGAETELDTFTTGITHVAGTSVRVRFQGTGTALKAKAWLASGDEPGVWHVEATDSSLTAADTTGVRSFSTTGNTNVNPEVRFDNFEMVNPQTFTVTRSSNGVSKSHSAGADIQLRDTVAVAF